MDGQQLDLEEHLDGLFRRASAQKMERIMEFVLDDFIQFWFPIATIPLLVIGTVW